MSSTPKFLLDENVPLLVKKFLKSEGYSAEYEPKGTEDIELVSSALEKKAILISRDRDFLNPIMFPPKQFSGIIVLTSHPPLAETLVNDLKSVLSKVRNFKGKLFVIDNGKFEELE